MPSTITITAVQTNVCNNRIYRYRAPALTGATATTSAATGYQWTLPIGPVGSTGILDSGTLNSSVIKIRYFSNAAAGIGDSIKLAFTSPCFITPGPAKAVKLTNTATVAPAVPTAITMQLVSDVCGARVYRYIAPNLPAATTTAVAATGWEWAWLGTLASTAVIDSGNIYSQKVKLRFSSNNAATIGDSVYLHYTSGCTVPSAWRIAFLSNLAKLGCKPPTTKSTNNDDVSLAKANDLMIYPNPTVTDFTIQLSAVPTDPVYVHILDMQGKSCYKKVFTNTTNMRVGESLTPGTYQAEIFIGTKKFIRKIIKITQ